jgi:hypothetical protein
MSRMVGCGSESRDTAERNVASSAARCSAPDSPAGQPRASSAFATSSTRIIQCMSSFTVAEQDLIVAEACRRRAGCDVLVVQEAKSQRPPP